MDDPPNFRPELASRIRTVSAQLQDFRSHLDELPPSTRSPLERSLSDTIAQLNALTSCQPQPEPSPRTFEEQWRSLSTCLPVGIFSCDIQGRCTYINARCEQILGWKLEDSIGDRWIDYVHPDDRDRIVPAWIEDATAGRPHRDEFRIITPDGEIRWLSARTAPILTETNELIGHSGTIENITKQKIAEEQIKTSLQEKEALLKEIHHRVKNNLQIISSLIYLQAQRIDDPAVRQIFEDSQSRISSMALVHDSLYRSQDFARVDLSDYVQTLTSSLFHTYRIHPDTVALKIQIDPNVIVSLEKAIPCGLILNELMTNALKHGFIDQQTGEITVILEDRSPKVCLTVENNGKNLPQSFELQKIHSMGLRLVDALVNQLNGQLSVETTQKIRFKVTFDCA